MAISGSSKGSTAKLARLGASPQWERSASSHYLLPIDALSASQRDQMGTSGSPSLATLGASPQWERSASSPCLRPKNSLSPSLQGQMGTSGSKTLASIMGPARLGGSLRRARSASSHCPITSLTASQEDRMMPSG